MGFKLETNPIELMKSNKLHRISFVWFTILLYKNKPISARKIHLILFYYSKIILSIPLSLITTLIVHKRIEKVEIKQDPVFILGHFRSGTTYLQKLLLADNNFGYLSNYDFLFPNLSLLTGRKTRRILQAVVKVLNIKNFHFNNYNLQLDDPNEEDLLLASTLSRCTSTWGFLFPKNWRNWLIPGFFENNFTNDWSYRYQKLIKSLTYKAKGKRLLLKNPPNTGRVGILLKLFPDAKFIYIGRNPYHLYYSLKNLWKNVICKYYALQKVDDEIIDKIIFEHFIAIKDKYENEKYLIPKGNLIEISFEELESSPFEVIKRIYLKLNIIGFSEMENELKRVIEREKKYKKFTYKYSSKKASLIENYWGRFITNGNYTRPELVT